MQKYFSLLNCLFIFLLIHCVEPEAAGEKHGWGKLQNPPEAPQLFAPFKPAWKPSPQNVEVNLWPGEPYQDHYLEARTWRRYRITASPGFFGRIDVLQCGLDVELNFADHLGTALYIDRPTGSNDSEWVSFLSEKDGDYTLTVYASRAGYYTIGFKEWRLAREGDRQQVEAEKQFVKAFQLVINGSPEDGLSIYEELTPYYQNAGQTYSLALLKYAKGSAYRDLGRKKEALLYYEQAANLFGAQDSVLKGVILNNQGFLYHGGGDRDLAFQSYFSALQVFREHGNTIQEGRTLLNIAMLCQELGHFQRAMDFNNNAFKFLKGTGLPLEQAALNNMGVLFGILGEPEKALEYHLAALASWSFDNIEERARFTLNVGALYQELGDRDNASRMYDIALEIAENNNVTYIKQMGYQIIGDFYLARDDVEKALGYFKQVEARSGKMQFNLGRAYFQKFLKTQDNQELKIAAEHLEAALSWSRQNKAPRLEIDTIFFLAQVRHHQGRDNPISLINHAIRMVENQRKEVLDANLRNTFFASNQNLTDLKIKILMDRHQSSPQSDSALQALHQFEKATARHLIDVLTNGTQPVNNGSEYQLFNTYWETRLKKLRLQDPNPQLSQTLDQELATMEQALVRTRSAAEITTANIMEASQIQNELSEPGTLILEYYLGDEASYLWAISNEEVQSFSLPPRGQLEPQISEVVSAVLGTREAGNMRKKQQKALQLLSKQLLGPISLKGIKRLAIVASGSLQQLPFGVLPIEDEPETLLIDKVEVAYLPSASVLAAMRKEHRDRKQPEKLLLAFADPVFSTEPQPNQVSVRSGENIGARDWAPLPLTGLEAKRILERARQSRENLPSKMISGFNATREAVLGSEPEQYRILHFATHGHVDPQNPSRSALILSLYNRDHSPRNGFLTLKDITWLNLNADLVVLSACDTALGKEVRGEGLISLARGFMVAGAPRVVATLWPVADDTTALLMDHFYKNMLQDGLPPASALRAAQLTMKQHFPNAPYYWAGFVLIGDWQ